MPPEGPAPGTQRGGLPETASLSLSALPHQHLWGCPHWGRSRLGKVRRVAKVLMAAKHEVGRPSEPRPGLQGCSTCPSPLLCHLTEEDHEAHGGPAACPWSMAEGWLWLLRAPILPDSAASSGTWGQGVPTGVPAYMQTRPLQAPLTVAASRPPLPAPGPRRSLDPFTDHSYVLACAHWCRALSIHPRESQCQARSS